MVKHVLDSKKDNLLKKNQVEQSLFYNFNIFRPRVAFQEQKPTSGSLKIKKRLRVFGGYSFSYEKP